MVPIVTQEDKQMRLSWRGVLGVMFGTAALAFIFISLRRFDLARPSMVSIAMVGLAIVMRWKLRKHVWFWVTMTFSRLFTYR